MDEALIDELWNRCFKTEISGSPVSDSCMHDFVSYDMNERWCTECGKYLNGEVGKFHVAEPSKTLRNLPCDTSSKEKYFLSVLENFLGEESITSSNLSALWCFLFGSRAELKTWNSAPGQPKPLFPA